MNYLLRGLLLIHPFIQYLFIGKFIPTTLALSGIVFVFIAFLFFLTNEKENFKIQFPYLWLWAFLSTIFLNRNGSINNMDVSILYFIHISIFFIFYYTVLQSKIDWEYIVKPLGYVCMIYSLLSILQYYGIEQFKYDLFQKPGLLANPTNTAMYITATSPFLLQYKRGWLWFSIPVIACILLNSASALLGILGIIVSYLLIKKYFLRLILFTSTCGIIAYFKFEKIKVFLSTQDKLYIWGLAIKDWMKSAWWGYGLGHFEYKYTTSNGAIFWNSLHNHYLYILYTLGIIGLFFLFVWLIPIFKNAYKIRQQMILPLSSIISVAVMSSCSVPMRIYPIVLLTGFNLAILTKSLTKSLTKGGEE